MKPLLTLTALASAWIVAVEITPAASADLIKDSASVDALIEKGYQENNVKPNPMATDEVLVRRLYLDVIGRIPTQEETMRYLDDRDPQKAAKLVDALIASEGYVSHHYNYWGDILRVKTLLNGAGQSRPAGYAYQHWLKDAIRNNLPYDEFVYSLVNAQGQSWENGAVGYYLRDFGMSLCNMATTTQIFLGTSVHCAQCHNHPFDKWTQMDFFQAASYQYNVLTTNTPENQEAAFELMDKQKKKVSSTDKREIGRAFSEILKPLRFNQVKHTSRDLRLPSDYQYSDAKPKGVIEPKVMFGHEVAVSEDEQPVESYARWMTSDANPRFTTVIANRMWKKVMGKGLFEPVDELTDSSEASHPELMTFLEQKMREYDYDLRKFMAMLYNTRTYQRASTTEDVLPGMVYHYPGPLLHRMTAEQIWDSIVTLALDDPDAINPYVQLDEEKVITRTKWIAESVYDQTPAEFLEGAKEIRATQKRLAGEMRELAEKRAAAVEAGDVTLAKKLAKESDKKSGELVRAIESTVYQKGFEDKVQLVAANLSDKKGPETTETADDFLVELASCVQDGTMSMDQLKDSPMTEVVKAVLAEEENGLKAWADECKTREWKDWDVKTADDQKSWYSFNSLRRSTIVRASDLSQPAPRGHFLREFGQSDREVVDNASLDATITQALNLLNGSVHSGLRNPYSRIRREISAAETPEEKLNAIYLNVYNRLPANEERDLLLPMIVENPGQGPLDALWTVLNTRQFIFIQ